MLYFISKKNKITFQSPEVSKGTFVDFKPFKKCRIFLSILHFLHDKPLINYTFKISFTISFILSESHSLLCLI